MINFVEDNQKLIQKRDNEKAVSEYESFLGLSGPLIANIERDSDISLLG